MLVKVLVDEHPDGIAWCSTRRARRSVTSSTPTTRAIARKTPDHLRAGRCRDPRGGSTPADPQIEVPDVEADDVIATLATRAAAEGIDVIIAPATATATSSCRSARQGALQQARRVRLAALPTRPESSNPHRVTPAQYPEYAALRGRSGTTCPVSRHGEKTAAKLVNAYGTSRDLRAPPTSCHQAASRTSMPARERVFLNRQMSKLRLDCDVDRGTGRLRMGRGIGSGSGAVRTARVPPLLRASSKPSVSRRPRPTSRSSTSRS